MIKITLKDGYTYDIVEETEDVFFYVGRDGFNKYVGKHKVVNVERTDIKNKKKKSILFNLLMLATISILIASYFI